MIALALATLLGQAPPITHGPVLGRPSATSMSVWARTVKPGTFHVRYGTGDALTGRSRPVATSADRDCSGVATLEGLRPGTTYRYRVYAGDDDGSPGPEGTFRTWPAPKDYVDAKTNPRGLFDFRFVVGSCANQGTHSLGPKLPLYRTMLDANLHKKALFSIHNGDWLYEDTRDATTDAWRAETGEKRLPRELELVPSLAGVWANYRLYWSRGKNLAEWHRHVPTYYTFDDHEILNDVVGSGHVGLRNRRAVFRDPALAAWENYLGWANGSEFAEKIRFGRATLRAGSDRLVDPEADFARVDPKTSPTLHVLWGGADAGVDDVALDKKGGDPNAGVYKIEAVVDAKTLQIRPAPKRDGEAVYSLGKHHHYRWRVGNCEFFAVDTRSHRESHDGDRPERRDVTLLGLDQKAWLRRAMSASDADFLFVVSSIPFFIPHDGAGGMSFQADDKNDSWTAYLAERAEMLAFWETLGRPVIVLTGDLHNSFVVKASERIWEFCCGPLNSTNHPAGSEGKRPPNGPYRSRDRDVDIRWSTWLPDETPRELRRRPVYTVVQVNNVFDAPLEPGRRRWWAFPRPQVVMQYYDGLTGELLYAEPIRCDRERNANQGP